MPLLRGGRPLKQWRYVGIFGEQLMACAALVQLGPLRQSFWALYLREERKLYQRTRLLPRRRELQLRRGTRDASGQMTSTGALIVRDRGVELELDLEEATGVEARCPNGRQQVWTRKQAGVPARGTLRLGQESPHALQARAVIDDTAGYHERHTEWWWSAGVGRSPEGHELAWNLVSGVNDPAHGSERAVWIDGEPRETTAVRFSEDLGQIVADDGSELRFDAEAERSRSENFLILKSDYRAPFGRFSGTLPGGVTLAHGLGVVEHHRALW
jgi:Protein of unknown function (DUF2804)